MNLTDIKKDLSVLILIILLFVMDLCHVDDAALKYMLMGLVASITGFGGFQASPLNPANKTYAAPASISVVQGGPAAPQQ